MSSGRRDDLGHPLGDGPSLSHPAQRVVSLVPSLTEALAATRPGALLGATEWCTQPPDLDVVRVRGTKNPDLKMIEWLRPDLVIANQEENRKLDVRRLRDAGIPVWVTRIQTVDEAFTSMRAMFGALGWAAPGWLAAAEAGWAPCGTDGRRVAVCIWRDPWMVVGSQTFTGDVLARLGLVNVFGDSAERYPHVSVEQILAARPDLIVLPDEPYVFTADDGPEAFAGANTRLVEGRSLTWYGPSLLTARETLIAALS